jgi:hypothetical protein
MGVKPAEGKNWAIAYLFKHQDNGTAEFPRYYIWEVPSVPGSLKHASAAASETAERNTVEYHGKLPRGSCRGENPPWEGNPEDDDDCRGAVSSLEERANAVWQCCVYKRAEDALDQMASLIHHSLILFGVSARFFLIMSILDRASSALQANDFDTAKDELHGLVTMCGMLRRNLASVYSSESDTEKGEPECDDLIDRIIDAGKVVFSHDWDSGGPGAGAGSDQVYHWKGKFVSCSLDFGNAGPFTSLDEALQEQDLLTVTGATTGIQCSMLSASEIAKRLHGDEEGFEIEINGEAWVYRAEAGEFKRKRGKK